MEATVILKISALSVFIIIAIDYFKLWQRFKNFLDKIRQTAIKHGISPIVFLIIWFATTIIRYFTSWYGAHLALKNHNGMNTGCVIGNRLAAFAIPAYILWATRKKHFQWWVYAIYISLWIFGGVLEIIAPKWFLYFKDGLWKLFLDILGIH
jgi:hypothetical protein